ncbi:ABC transporter permease [Marinoscillum sp.]|uniref:ABC transporter permease n=1 Tax=Marinoscillum sp. TaxID=2024838 RepID=UPI003BACD4E0
MNHRPPQFLTKILRSLCKDQFYEELQGDLEERFFRDIKSKGLKNARRRYNMEMIKLLRPSVIKSPKIPLPMNHFSILQNYLIVALRNIKRQKLFSAINVIGLAISMAVGLITISFITEMENYDSFHEKADRIYRVTTTRTNHLDQSNEYASTSLLVGEKLADDYGGVEEIVQINKGMWGDLEHDEKMYKISGHYVSSNYLSVFSFPLIAGNPETALKEPNTILLTEDLADKIFGTVDVIGQTLKFKEETYTITAVIRNLPKASHIQFDALASLSTLQNDKETAYHWEWNTMWSSYIYLLFPEDIKIETVQSHLDAISKEENDKVSTFSMHLNLESMADIFPGDGKFNEIGITMTRSYIQQIVLLSIIVLFSACFNYANLSIARSLKRAKEIGIRKVIGARKRQLFNQFILEAVLVSLFSLVIAVGLFVIIRPYFIDLTYSTRRTATLALTPEVVAYFVAFAVVIGILAGMIPSSIMARFKPVSILKGISIKGDRGMSLRKVMVAVQFILSIGLATLVYLTEKQYQFALNYDLGFNTENILNIEVQGNDAKLLKSALSQLPEVSAISESSVIPSIGNTNSDHARLLDQPDSFPTYSNYVDPTYLDNLGHQLVAGTNFTPGGPNDQMIVNEHFVKKFGINNPEDAIGKRVHYYSANKTIIGVVRDFNYGTIYNKIDPFAFLYHADRTPWHLNLKIQSTDMVSTLDKIDAIWRDIDSNHELEARFYDQQIQDYYQHLQAKTKMYGMLAFIAISISLLGMLGMVVYTTELKMKELTIRKVLGAELKNLIVIISRNFSWIFLIATIVAIPASYYLYLDLTESMVHKMDLNPLELIIGAVPILIIGCLIVLAQTVKASRTNPAKTLRDE